MPHPHPSNVHHVNNLPLQPLPWHVACDVEYTRIAACECMNSCWCSGSSITLDETVHWSTRMTLNSWKFWTRGWSLRGQGRCVQLYWVLRLVTLTESKRWWLEIHWSTGMRRTFGNSTCCDSAAHIDSTKTHLEACVMMQWSANCLFLQGRSGQLRIPLRAGCLSCRQQNQKVLTIKAIRGLAVCSLECGWHAPMRAQWFALSHSVLLGHLVSHSPVRMFYHVLRCVCLCMLSLFLLWLCLFMHSLFFFCSLALSHSLSPTHTHSLSLALCRFGPHYRGSQQHREFPDSHQHRQILGSGGDCQYHSRAEWDGHTHITYIYQHIQ